MRLSYLGKALLLWQITILLLPPPCLPALFSGSRISYQAKTRKALQHPCGCPLEGGCRNCRCIACRGSCCAGFKKKSSPVCHSNNKIFSGYSNHKNPATIFIRVIPCGGPPELNVNSFGKVKFILTRFSFLLGFLSALLARNTPEKPDNLSFKPPVPPPEITPLFSTASI